MLDYRNYLPGIPKSRPEEMIAHKQSRFPYKILYSGKAFSGYWLKVRRFLTIFVLILLSIVLLVQSSAIPIDETGRVRKYTQETEFDFVTWTVDALMLKQAQAALSLPSFLSASQQHQLVKAYLGLVDQRNQVRAKIDRIYANPEVKDPATQSKFLIAQLNDLDALQKQSAPIIESILQDQVSATIHDMGLSLGGQPIPPVVYHVTDLPLALIVSPRNVIRQDADISLLPGMTASEMAVLEKKVEKDMNVSALVVPVGGIGIYPPMVMSTTDLPWLVEVIAHEWTHNYLTLRPLGLSYESTAEMRSINETTASISGNEIGQAVVEKYYPEYIEPDPPATSSGTSKPAQTGNEKPAFNYRAEMHTTRVTADKLLAEGKIDEAEQYMESQRQVFWQNGYQIRRLNQAYFAFYGAYADVPGGAAGTDPVGPAVRALRAQSGSLANFINRISWITSFDELKKMISDR
jgi:hypothetical protein